MTAPNGAVPDRTEPDLRLSIARESFADARRLVVEHELVDPRGGIAVQFVPDRPPMSASGGSVASDLLPPTGPVHAALAAQAAGTTTAGHLVERSIEAIEASDGPLHAVVAIDLAEVRAEADRRDVERGDGRPLGPLHGIPITVKDVIDVAGLPTRAGSEAYLDHPALDAVSVARLRAAGAIVLAKTSTHEFALGVTNPQSRNPHDATRIPGGSSGGSAIAVATGMGLASLGTDTRASIRVPAALSGTVGFKPTFGTVPTDGVVTLSWTMDHVAPMAASVADAALLVEVLQGRSTSDLVAAAGRSIAGQRIGLPDVAWLDAEPAVAAAIEQGVAVLVEHGAIVSPCPGLRPEHLDQANAAGLVISRCEAATAHRALGTDLSRCWPEIADQLHAALDTPAADYLEAQRIRAELATELGSLFADFDVLAMPTVPVVAPPADDFARYLMILSRNAIPWSLIGVPAISVPCGTDLGGLPIGIQLVAPAFAEARLVTVASTIERALSPRTPAPPGGSLR